MVETDKSNALTLKSLILGMKEYFYYFIAKWFVFAFFIVVGALIGFFYAKSKQVKFIATTSFVIDSGNEGSSKFGGLLSMAGVDMIPGGESALFQGDNLYELYKSRVMITKTLLSPNPDNPKELIVDDYIRVSQRGNDLIKLGYNSTFFLSDVKSEKQQRLRDSLLNIFYREIKKDGLEVQKADKKSSIVNVITSSNNERFSKNLNTTLVKTVNSFYLETKTKKSRQNLEILQKKVDSISKNVNVAIFESAQAIDNTPNLNPTRQILRVVPMQRAQARSEVNKQIYGQLIQNLELAKVTLLKETPLIQIIDNPLFPLEKKESNPLIYLLVFGFFGFLCVVFVLFFIKNIADILGN